MKDPSFPLSFFLLSTHPSIHLFIFTHPFFNMFILPFAHLLFYSFICLSIKTIILPLIHLPIHSSLFHPSIHPSTPHPCVLQPSVIWPPILPSILPSARQSYHSIILHPSLSPPLLHSFIHPSFQPSLHLSTRRSKLSNLPQHPSARSPWQQRDVLLSILPKKKTANPFSGSPWGPAEATSKLIWMLF